MADRVLTKLELNRALLARQLLLERADLTIPRALERIGGLQDQYAPSGYIGLWTRLRAFDRGALTHALERSAVVQATMMRATIHLVSKHDFWPFWEAIEEPLLAWWFRSTGRAADRRRLRSVDRRSRALLAKGPLRRAEIMAGLGLAADDWAGVGLWTPLVRVPPSGTWDQRRADLFALAEDRIGPSHANVAEGRALLVRRYLAAFGPAGRTDISTFTGLPIPALDPVLERLSLRRFRDEAGGLLLDVRGGALPDETTPSPARFLPTWDASLLVHARRTGIVPEDVRPRIFNTRMPQSVGTVLVDGQVRATWRLVGARVRVEPLTPIPRRFAREVAQEASALGAFCA